MPIRPERATDKVRDYYTILRAKLLQVDIMKALSVFILVRKFLNASHKRALCRPEHRVSTLELLIYYLWKFFVSPAFGFLEELNLSIDALSSVISIYPYSFAK